MTQALPTITRRRAMTQQRLLTAASVIIAERGLHGATVEDICEAAGFTRGAFYSNFADKEQLFSALLRQEKEQLLARIDRVISDETPIRCDGDVIDELVEKVLAAHPRDRQSHLVHAEFSLHAIRNPEAARQMIQEDDEFKTELARLLEAGLVRAGRRLSVPADDAVATMIAGFEIDMRELLLREAAAEPGFEAPHRPDSGLARRTLPLIIRALSEPLPG